MSVETYSEIYEAIITHPASVNLYMFVGSTSFGFTNGANTVTAGMDNSGIEPDTTRFVRSCLYSVSQIGLYSLPNDVFPVFQKVAEDNSIWK